MALGHRNGEAKNFEKTLIYNVVGYIVFTGVSGMSFQRYGSIRCMLIGLETPGRNSIVTVPLTCACSMT